MPHSDIRGSTIARISPRLFAACHVLHRLLAPRHPPDALLTLITSLIQPPPARRTKPHTRTPRPKPKSTSTQGPTPQRPIRSAAVPANSHTQSTCRPANKPQPASTPTCAPQLPIHLSMNMPTPAISPGSADLLEAGQQDRAKPHPARPIADAPHAGQEANTHATSRLESGARRSASFSCQEKPQPGCIHIQRHSPSLKGGDPAAGSPTATLLRLHPSH